MIVQGIQLKDEQRFILIVEPVDSQGYGDTRGKRI